MDHHLHHTQSVGDISQNTIDGELTSISLKGLFGAKTFFEADGHELGHIQPNIFGGNDIFHGHHLDHSTMPIKGGIADVLHPEHTVHILKTGNTTMGTVNGEVEYMSTELGNGFSDVMTSSDPLMDISNYSMPALHL